MFFLAQATEENVNIFDNQILDQWELPFGQWIDQMVDWIDLNMGPVLDVIRWPFSFLLENLVDNFIAEVSWVWICLAVLIIGSLVRNVKVGLSAAVALAGCGLLGTNYWFETARTIGMILVAVILCALVGIPVGILCGRFDSVWNVVRPTLDAMQVVHAFVYMLPVIFFFSFGVVPGTMVTMIFAIPPLIRLTNLGIRQVPEDVVEASRAFGAPEFRVLTDVQLPLARPAIMTGLNQTLLLSISMIGIAAIMGAGGLGLLVFRAVQNLDVGLAASAGLALFLVAVVLDRISQPEVGDGVNLMARIGQAWANRNTPEALLDSPTAEASPATVAANGSYTPVESSERMAMMVAIGAAAVAMIATLMTWGRDGGLISGYARRADEDLAGESFNGLSASGGSWFGIFVLVAGAFVVIAGINTLLRAGRGGRWLSADGAIMAAGVLLASSFAYLLAAPADSLVTFSRGPGPALASVASAVAFAAVVLWLVKSPYGPIRPLPGGISYGRLISGTAALGFAVIAMFSGWSFDKRADTVITPELQLEIDDVMSRVGTGELSEAIAAQEIQRINNTALAVKLIVIDGKSDAGAGLGVVTLVLTIAGFIALIPAVGLISGTDPRRHWMWSAISAGIGVGVMSIAAAWAVSIMRVADNRFYSGAGGLLAFIAGFLLLAASRRLLTVFRRRKVYRVNAGVGDDLVDAVSLTLDGPSSSPLVDADSVSTP